MKWSGLVHSPLPVEATIKSWNIHKKISTCSDRFLFFWLPLFDQSNNSNQHFLDFSLPFPPYSPKPNPQKITEQKAAKSPRQQLPKFQQLFNRPKILSGQQVQNHGESSLGRFGGLAGSGSKTFQLWEIGGSKKPSCKWGKKWLL